MLMESADAVKYGWVDAEVAGTQSIMSTEAVIGVAKIMVGDPLD